MPLENLEGDSVFINALVATNPTGTDYPFPDGDNHIRGIKKVLKNTFPNFVSQITRSSEDVNRGSVPAGSVMVFYNASAPAGWTRAQGLVDTKALRVVATGSVGGGYGGSDNPVLNDKVASHTHPVNAVTTLNESVGHTHSGTTGSESADHNHSGTTGADSPDHSHLQGTAGSSPYFPSPSGSVPTRTGGDFDYTTGASARHYHNFTTGGRSAAHTHGFTSGDRSQAHVHSVPAHNTSANASAANWTPRYLDVILCVKS